MSQLSRFRPFFDRVLVQRAVVEAKTKGGVLLPEAAKGKAPEGTVVAVGPGLRTQNGEQVAPCVKVGDTVILPEYGGQTMKFDDKEYILFRDSDIIGKLE